MTSCNPNDYLQDQFFEQLEYEELVKNYPLGIDLDTALEPLFQLVQPLSINQAFEFIEDNPENDFVRLLRLKRIYLL